MSTTIIYPIRLDQFLKLANLVSSGGEAKILIADGQVQVNGEIEQRRGKKLQAEDSVQVGDSDGIKVGDALQKT